MKNITNQKPEAHTPVTSSLKKPVKRLRSSLKQPAQDFIEVIEEYGFCFEKRCIRLANKQNFHNKGSKNCAQYNLSLEPLNKAKLNLDSKSNKKPFRLIQTIEIIDLTDQD